jgi:hypothetical protein
VPFQVDPMLIPMFGRGNLSKKFAAGGGVKSGVTSKPINAVRTKNYAFGGGVSQLDQPKIEEPTRGSDIDDFMRSMGIDPKGNISPEQLDRFNREYNDFLQKRRQKEETHDYEFKEHDAILANSPPYDPRRSMMQEGMLRMSRGGKALASIKEGAETAQKAVKEAAKKTRKYPIKLPDPKPLSREDIRSMAQRMSQQVTGEFVRPDPTKSVNPAGKSRKQFEREQALSKNIRSAIAEPTVPVVDIEKQLDKLLVGLPGDPSIGGILRPGSFDEAPKGTRELVGIGDVELDVPAQLFGGSRYGAESVFDPEQDPAFWASNLGSARAIQNQITELSQAMDDRPVLSMFTKMTPEASNFALHTLDALLGYQQPHRLPKTKRQQLERAIRKGTPKQGKFPGFPGFENPEDVLLAAKSDTELRKHLINTLWKPTVTEPLKLRPGLDVLSAISHPEIENLPPGTSGFSMGRMRPGAELTPSAHPTYSHDIPGEFFGATKYPLPLELAFPRTTSFVRENIPTGEVFNTSKGVGLRDVIDPQYVDQIKLYEEFMKRYTGKKKGGAVRKGALAAVLS